MSVHARALPVALLALLLTSCGSRPGAEDEVRARFGAFELARRADDTEALFDLVTRDSLPALEALQPGAARQRGALLVEGVDVRDASRSEVRAREAGGEGATFVLVREAGAWRVDLLETVATTHGTVQGAPEITPSGLDPAQIDRIRNGLGEGLD
ncbi:MAG: hypothetical protein ACO4CT_15160 [Planctomycetota bacterium]